VPSPLPALIAAKAAFRPATGRGGDKALNDCAAGAGPPEFIA
jgi:hypothetical protein